MSKNTTHPALLLMLLLASSVALAAGQMVGFPPSNCTRQCGAIEVPYPLGLADDPAGDDCTSLRHLNHNMTCNSTYSPPKLLYGDVEVTGIDISSARIGLLLPLSYNCFNNDSGFPFEIVMWKNNLGASYRLSSTENEFIAVGCETMARFWIGNQTFGGCISGCSSQDRADEGECSGFGCCRTPIPKDIEWYETNYYYREKGSRVYGFNPCSYIFIAEKGNYTFHRSDLESMDKNRTFPVVVDWAIGRVENLTCREARRNQSSYACVAANSECLDSVNGLGYVCNCSRGYTGNPYLHDGCQGINE